MKVGKIVKKLTEPSLKYKQDLSRDLKTKIKYVIKAG